MTDAEIDALCERLTLDRRGKSVYPLWSIAIAAIRSLRSERDEFKYALEREFGPGWEDMDAACVFVAHRERDALRTERDALRRDAERYRWLRDNGNIIARTNFRMGNSSCTKGPVANVYVDAYVDSAMQGEQQK